MLINGFSDAGLSDRELLAALRSTASATVLNFVVVENPHEIPIKDATLVIGFARTARVLAGNIEFQRFGERMESKKLDLIPGGRRWALIVTPRWAIEPEAISAHVGDLGYVPLRTIVSVLIAALLGAFCVLSANFEIRKAKNRWLLGDKTPRIRRFHARRREISARSPLE